MTDSKEVVVNALVDHDNLTLFVRESLKEGVNLFICSPDKTELVKRAGGVTIAASRDADIFLASSLDEVVSVKVEGRPFALSVKVEGSEDVEAAVSAAKMGARAVVVETSDWKIIPLENLIAGIHRFDTCIYAKIGSVDEVVTMFSILERGVDGVVLATEKMGDVKEVFKRLSSIGRVALVYAKVTEVKSLGLGDRACIDTASILKLGEGILVGSQARTLFLVHNESSGSKFTSPRPFRVNAGSIHSYILMSNGKTKYLSELESGDEVLAVDSDGNTRTVLIGRVKIERRPLTLVKVEYEGGSGSILLQNAETIPLIGRDGRQIPVTELKVGDEVLVRPDKTSGRHFGVAVDEFILEK